MSSVSEPSCSNGSRATWQDTVRAAEDLGYDVILAADHIGRTAPFPALVAAAAVTSTTRLGTFVLNAAFYQPSLLARDIATTDQLVDGRLEVGLGAGTPGRSSRRRSCRSRTRESGSSTWNTP